VLLSDLANSTLLFARDSPISQIEATFLREDSLLTLLVGDAQEPETIGLIERGPFLTFLSGPLGFGRAIFSGKSLAEFDAPPALILEAWTSVADAAAMAAAREPDRWADSIVVPLSPGFGIVRAATLFKHVTDEMSDQLSIDQLTGAFNRRGFLHRLATVCGRSTEGDNNFVLLLLDLDGFKLVNDALGHQAGDDLLRSCSRRIARALPNAVVARMGGDEFAALVELEPGMTLDEAALSLVLQMALPTQVAGTEVVVAASVGVVEIAAGCDPNELIHRADVALYRAKGDGKNCYRVFDAGISDDLERQLLVSQQLRHAITNDLVQLHYQPIVDLDTLEVVAFEALARWTSPTMGTVPPDEFIGLAERTGLIVRLGGVLLRQAVHCLTAVDEATLKVHVNMSRRELQQPDLVREVKRLLGETGVDPTRLLIEVTETSVADDPKRMIATLHRLSDLGIRIALDDFGAGATALSNLWHFPLDIVKLDRSLIAPLLGPGDRVRTHETRVQAIIDLCHAHDLVVTAEGVEHPEQADALRTFGCDYAQGWYFGRPTASFGMAHVSMPAPRG
jgi:diguanylate cyclase (GGDEF)-like protein